MLATTLFLALLFQASISILAAPAKEFFTPYSRLASNLTKLDNFYRNSPDLSPSYGYLSERAYGKPDMETGKRVAEWHPETHGMNPEELGSYERGDILIPRTAPPPQGNDVDYTEYDENLRNGLVEPSTRWPGGYIPYWIQGHFEPEELNTIFSAMEVFHSLTCIHFVPWSGEEDYLSIENTATGCWSSVGRIGGRQMINLQTPACVWGLGTTLHEFMHTIGFYHEQSRHERDSYVQIFWKNVLQGEEHNFQKFPKSVALSKVPYDFNSVMHYSGIAFSKNENPTMKPKHKGISLGQRDFLSERDVKKVRLMYKCNGNIANV